MNFIRIKSLLRESDGGAPPAGGGAPPTEAPPAAPPPTTTDLSFLKPDYTFEEGWQNKLPDEQFGDTKATLANYKTLPALAKALKEAKTAAMSKLEGYDKLPTEKSTPEERKAFFKKLGVPESVEGYGFKAPDGELSKYFDPAKASAFAQMAHKLNISSDAAAEIIKWNLETVAAENAAVESEGTKLIQEREAKLKSVWGNQYDANMLEVERVMKTVGVPMDELLLTSPELSIGLATLAKRMSEDALVSRDAVRNNISQAALARDIQTNPSNPDYAAYRDQSHPRHKEVVQRVLDYA